ncbi:ATP-binding protein [Mucilaginibacter sp. ZT4R22]|uniref:histidine kinase n=1 Tax=Mucilaginibacter pankratovii TaxID=2772110 RepID=A0ABR7WSX9_9SPHI|nr:histidine kinase dimerization/phosphoacceptor domain -containing protein [Mucilaginibacter pankratovii]MBD1365412.1 ATP-binding protein [Mucilaginibacter pankratovii]
MNRFVLTISFLLLLSSVRGQDQTRHSVDSLIKILNKSLPDTAHVSALLKLAEFQISKAGENKAGVDSAAGYIAQAERLNARIKSDLVNGRILMAKSSLLRKIGQRDAGIALGEKAIQVLNQNSDKYLLAQAYSELSHYYDDNDPKQLVTKIKIIKAEAAAYQLAGKVMLAAKAYGFLGDLYMLNNEYEKAIEVLQLSIAAYKSAHYSKVHSVYLQFASAYFSLGNYKQALNYGLTALHTAESLKDTTMQLCGIYNTIGIILMDTDQNEKAIVYLKNALQIAERYNDASNSSTVLWNIVKSYIRLNKTEEAAKLLRDFPKKYLESKDYGSAIVINGSFIYVYTALRQYGKAIPYCNRVVDIINHQQISEEVLDLAYTLLVRYYFASGQYSLARQYLIKATNLVHKINEPAMIGRNSLQWFKLDSAEGNFRSANQYLLKYHQIKDSLFNEAKSKQIQQLQIQFETEKKEHQITLKDKDIRLLTQENKTANLVRNLTIGGIFLLVIIVGLLYKQFRNKEQANMVIMHKNKLLEQLLSEKDWLLKEVHHRVKNNLHTVICLLELQAANLESEALTAIENCQHRIYCMSLIHQKLYQSDELKTIDMAVYLPEFINYLSESFGILQQIRFNLDIENLKLGVSQAIPLALIINEAVTNSIKYAFPENPNGTITIQMVQRDDQITLMIADNGIGMPQEMIYTPRGSLGLNLIRGLCQDINAQAGFENDHGTKVTITFKNDQFNETSDFLNQPQQEAYS